MCLSLLRSATRVLSLVSLSKDVVWHYQWLNNEHSALEISVYSYGWPLIGMVHERWRHRFSVSWSIYGGTPALESWSHHWYGLREGDECLEETSVGVGDMVTPVGARYMRFLTNLWCGDFVWVAFAFIFIDDGRNSFVVTLFKTMFFGLHTVVASLYPPFLPI